MFHVEHFRPAVPIVAGLILIVFLWEVAPRYATVILIFILIALVANKWNILSPMLHQTN